MARIRNFGKAIGSTALIFIGCFLFYVIAKQVPR